MINEINKKYTIENLTQMIADLKRELADLPETEHSEDQYDWLIESIERAEKSLAEALKGSE